MSRLQKLEAFLQLVETQIYSEPEEGNFHTALIEDLVPKIVDPLQLPKDAMVLDVGCGYGAFMNLMRTRGYTNVTGITLSKEDLDACRRRGLRAVPMDLASSTSPMGASISSGAATPWSTVHSPISRCWSTVAR